MAIVDGRRELGWTFYKVRGKREWVAHNTEMQVLMGLCAEIEEGENPLEAKFHYCSGNAQPVFLDYSTYPGTPDRDHFIPSSWRKMPEEWRELFRRDVFYGEEGK